MVAKGKIVNTTPRNAWKTAGTFIKVMSASGAIRDPGLFHEHRRLRGPLKAAMGLGSYAEHDAKQRVKMAEKAKALDNLLDALIT